MNKITLSLMAAAALAMPTTAVAAHHGHQHAKPLHTLKAHRAQVEAALDSCERDSEATECSALEDEFADTYGLGTCELPSEEVECTALERELAGQGLWF